MTRQDLIDDIAETTGISKQAATAALDAVLEAIPEALARGEEVRLVGFGTFSAHIRAASEGRNPRTGEPLSIPERRVPKFKAAKRFTEALNQEQPKMQERKRA
jgi:DNA-binding protein HU-beta